MNYQGDATATATKTTRAFELYWIQAQYYLPLSDLPLSDRAMIKEAAWGAWQAAWQGIGDMLEVIDETLSIVEDADYGDATNINLAAARSKIDQTKRDFSIDEPETKE